MESRHKHPHRSEAVRRVKEGTALARVQSGLPDEWWDCTVAQRARQNSRWQDSVRE